MAAEYEGWLGPAVDVCKQKDGHDLMELKEYSSKETPQQLMAQTRNFAYTFLFDDVYIRDGLADFSN